MSALSLPQDVAEHLQAAIQLSNRRVQLRLLDESERLVTLGLPNAAIVVAGAVLESFLDEISGKCAPDQERQIAAWRELRDLAAHAGAAEVAANQATEMTRGVRQFLMQPMARSRITASELRGKYRFVPTSSDSFIERKADELRLEHQ